MAKKGGGGQRPIKGFRPGKEPAHLKKQRAKAQLGSNATWSQKQTVEALAGRSPQEVQQMVRNWTLGLMIGVVVAGVIVHVLAATLLFLAYRLRKQSSGLVEMSKALR